MNAVADEWTPARFRDLALVAARLGAEAIEREVRRGEMSIDTKSHEADFVTSADKAAEAAVLAAIASARDNDAVLAEESGIHTGDSGVRWLIDPLDGTMNFVHGRPDYVVSVGVEQHGRYIAGAIVRPFSGDWAAGGGGEALSRSGRAWVSSRHDLSEGLIGIGLPSPMEQRFVVHDLIAQLMPLCRDYRRSGSTASDLLSVALGQQEGYLGFGVQEWDYAGGAAVVEAAGGTWEWITTASGIGVIVAGPPPVTSRLVELVKEI
ncbi:MAG TPA: inositol monophosphatase family protein [Actinopolymorphaceae bacterium]